jgi:hypothetical protein
MALGAREAWLGLGRRRTQISSTDCSCASSGAKLTRMIDPRTQRAHPTAPQACSVSPRKQLAKIADETIVVAPSGVTTMAGA